MDKSSFSMSPRWIRPAAIVLLIASFIVGIVFWDSKKGVAFFGDGALFIGQSVANWTMNYIETVLKAFNVPVPEKRQSRSE